MGKGTSIEWTDHSWPVVNGCRRVSAGCENCYAERLTATRLSKTPKYEGLAVMGKNGPRWTGKTRLWARDLEMPLRIRKPSRIFVADMGDLFYEGVQDRDIAAVFGVMAACPQHTFQVLTKRPERMRRWIAEACLSSVVLSALVHISGQRLPFNGPWPLPNVWLGVSVEDQATADERIPLLLDVPAAVRFVSYEPALGPVDFRQPWQRHLDGTQWKELANGRATYASLLQWIIVGGESGPRARPFHLEWAASVVDQCAEARVACFVKQVGSRPFNGGQPWAWNQHPMDHKGGDPEQWPENLRVREFPGVGGTGGGA